MWGVLTFVGNFVPYVGSLVALVLPVLLALLELKPPWRPLAVLALLLLVQFVTKNFVEPRLTAHAVDLSRLVVLVALAFWGLCWGAVGMVLAVPLRVMLKIVWGFRQQRRKIHHRIWRSRGGSDTADNMELLHANCHRQIHVRERRAKAVASREGRS
jgi:AI-2 transport protein TqsA